MPNWCENELLIAGPEDEVNKFIETSKKGDDFAIFENHIPTPNLENDGWYMWRLNNWGCKWDVDDPTLRYENTRDGIKEAIMYFNTQFKVYLVLLVHKVQQDLKDFKEQQDLKVILVLRVI